MDQIIYRDSYESDRDRLKALFEECFGQFGSDRSSDVEESDTRASAVVTVANDWLYRLDYRYIVAEVIHDIGTIGHGEIIAATGITSCKDSSYNGHEVDWTCCKEAYRHQGIITNMLRKALYDLDKVYFSDKPVYCSCWQLDTEPKIRLAHSMHELGFEEVQHAHRIHNSMHDKICKGCLYYHPDSDCICYEHLYKLDRV